MVNYIPKQGDIVWVSFDPQSGREIQKTRPALVISPAKYNAKRGLALFMPITSTVRGDPFEVIIDNGTVKGAILADQVRSLDWRMHNATFIMTTSKSILDEAIEKFRVLLPE